MNVIESIFASIDNLISRITRLESADPRYPPIYVAQANNSLSLTNAYQPVPGVTLTAPPGSYLINVHCRVITDSADSGKIITIELLQAGVATAVLINHTIASFANDTLLANTWLVTLAVATVLTIDAKMSVAPATPGNTYVHADTHLTASEGSIRGY